MRKLALLLSVLLVSASTLSAKQKVIMPLVVTNATYAFVTTYDGDAFNPGLTPEDREAVADVQQAIEKWGRYKLVYNPSQADLILIVRTGRAAETDASLQQGTRLGPFGTPGGSGRTIGAKSGDWQDTLDVYVPSQDLKTAPPLWRGRAVDGLKAPELRLMKDFQSKVEASAKKKP